MNAVESRRGLAREGVVGRDAGKVAFRRGHATRVGFEDSVCLPDGSTAPNNAALVRAALHLRPW